MSIVLFGWKLDGVGPVITDPPPISFTTLSEKLDGVGPVDNRPSTDKLHHFVQKKPQKTFDM